MAEYTHRIYNKNWHEGYLLDETRPNYAFSDVDGRVYTTHVTGGWLSIYDSKNERSDTVVERLPWPSLENK